MDQATALKILENMGAVPSNENIMKIMQSRMSESELLGKSLGLQGGHDESGPSMDLILDKLANKTQRGVAPVVEPASDTINPDSMTNGSAANGSARGIIPTAPVINTSRQDNYGPGPSPSRQSNYDSNSSPPGYTNWNGIGSLDWLKAALGLTATGGATVAANTAISRGRGANAGSINSANVRAPIPVNIDDAIPVGQLDEYGKSIPQKTEPESKTKVSTKKVGLRMIEEDGRPINMNDPERIMPPKNIPTNLEAPPLRAAQPYEGKPTNLQDTRYPYADRLINWIARQKIQPR